MDQPKFAPGYGALWLSIGLVPLILIALLLPLTPHDYWWYLRLGQDVLRMGRVPSVETYSFTQMGKFIINQPWLAAVIFWVAYNDGGLNLTFFLRAICIGVSYGLLWSWMRQMGAGPRLSAVLILVAGLASSNNWSFRPQMFAYPLFALSILILWRWQTGSHKSLWLLPLIAALWANLHDSFLLLLILEGTALVFGRGDRKFLALVTGISFLATLLTPYDFILWSSLAQSFFANPQWDVSSEWLPPSNTGWQMNIFFAWTLALAPLASLSKRRLSWLEWVWLLGLLWMSFSGIRYVIWGIFVLAAFSAHLLADWDMRWLERPARVGSPILNYALAGVFLLSSLVALPQLRSRLGIHAEPTISPDTPVQATEWLSQHPNLPGPLWSDLTYSSYLIFALPSRSVWIDTRFEMVYTPVEYQRYSIIASAGPGWDGLLDRSGINLIMLSVNGEPSLMQALQSSGVWCQEYRDSVAAIFSRRDPSGACP